MSKSEKIRSALRTTTAYQPPAYPKVGEAWERAVYAGISPSLQRHMVTPPIFNLGFVGYDVLLARELLTVMNEQKDMGHSNWRLPTCAEATHLFDIFKKESCLLLERYSLCLLTKETKNGTPLVVGNDINGFGRRYTLAELEVYQRFYTPIPYFRPVCNIS